MNVHALADFGSHRIEGFTNLGNHQFSVPLFSQIDGNLWTGGCPVGAAPQEFRFIVDLYGQPYATTRDQIVLRALLNDSHEQFLDEGRLLLLARHINACRDIGPTLVHCQAGLNRSALVAALALIERGMPAKNAIALLREKRCDVVLCNKSFESWLLKR